MPVRTDATYGTVEARGKQAGLNAVKLVVTSTSGGAASFSVGAVGKFSRLTIKPGEGAYQPTNSFDLTITDEAGVVLYTNTAISNSTTTVAYPSATNPIVVFGSCVFLFENMGSGKRCEVICYFEV